MTATPSHPVWDEWIEMDDPHYMRRIKKGLIPFGMSGLKSIAYKTIQSAVLSHPVWDEWIEMCIS